MSTGRGLVTKGLQVVSSSHSELRNLLMTIGLDVEARWPNG